MISRSPLGHPFQSVNLVLTLAQLKAINVDDNVNGEELFVGVNRYYYNATSVLAGDDLFVVAPTTGSGRYLLCPGQVDLSMAISFATADAAVLATLPTNCYMMVNSKAYWEITADWTGGASSAIGLSSSLSPHNTKGDLLGGSAGDVAAALTATLGITEGTIGADDIAGGFMLKPASTIRFDRVTSAFTAGTGFAHVLGQILRNPGV